MPQTLARVEDAIAAAEQRDQREQAAFHLETRQASLRGRARRRSDRRAPARDLPVAVRERGASAARTLYLRGGRSQDAIDALKISVWSDDRATRGWRSPTRTCSPRMPTLREASSRPC